MQHPITSQTVRFTIAAPFDCLKPGIGYRATPYRDGSGWCWRIDREDETSGTSTSGTSGTSLQNWQMIQLLAGAAGYQEISQ